MTERKRCKRCGLLESYRRVILGNICDECADILMSDEDAERAYEIYEASKQ